MNSIHVSVSKKCIIFCLSLHYCAYAALYTLFYKDHQQTIQELFPDWVIFKNF